MNKQQKQATLIFWIACCIYAVSLILPYRVESTNYNVVTGTMPSGDELKYISGIELIAPLFSLIPILLLMVFNAVQHSNFSRWFILISAILLVIPAVPFYFLVAAFCLYCKSEAGIGFHLYAITSVLFLIAAIVKFRIPFKRNKNVSTTDVLDNFQ